MEKIIISSVLLFAGIIINMFAEDGFTKVVSGIIVLSQILVLLVLFILN